MFTKISIHAVNVLDQDQALDFYVGKLGFEIAGDVDGFCTGGGAVRRPGNLYRWW